MPITDPLVWSTTTSPETFYGLNIAQIGGNSFWSTSCSCYTAPPLLTAIAYNHTGTTGGIGVEMRDMSLYPLSTPNIVTLSTATNTPDVAMANWTNSATKYYLTAIAYPTSSGVVVDVYKSEAMGDPEGATLLPTTLGGHVTYSYNCTPTTVHIDVMADFANTTTTGYPMCRYAVVTWDDAGTGQVYAAEIDLQAFTSLTLSPQAIGYGKDPDVAAIFRDVSSTPERMALITYTNASNTALYYNEWQITGSGAGVSSAVTLESLSGGSTVSIPRIDAIDDNSLNATTSGDAYYKVVAEVDNNSTGYSEVRTYDNLLTSGAGYWPSSDVIGLPLGYPAPQYNHFGPSVTLAGHSVPSAFDGEVYMVSHFTHVDASSDVVFIEPIQKNNSTQLATGWTAFMTPGAYHWVSEVSPDVQSTSATYVSAIGNVVNDPGNGPMTAWVYPDAYGQQQIEYKLTPCCWGFKQSPAEPLQAATSKDWQVYPNPAGSYLRIEHDNAGKNGTYEVTDLLGRSRMQGQLTGNTTTIKLSELAQGNYIVKMRCEDGSNRSQLIVKE